MDEQFDNQLNNHIRQVFENFEDHSADEGWMLLREKFPEKEKDRGVFWLWFGSAAAILLLALGIGTWVNLKKDEPVKLSYNPIKTHRQKNETPIDTEQSIKKQATLSSTTHLGKSTTANKPQNALPLITPKPVVTKSNVQSDVQKPAADDHNAENSLADKAIAANNKSIISPSLLNDTTAKNNNVAVAPSSTARSNTPAFTQPLTIKEQKATEKALKDNTTKSVQFSIYAATYLNYAKGSDNQINVGAGVTSDIRLSKNLKLSTGMAIAQNTLNYNNQLPNAVIHSGYLATISAASPGAYNISTNYSIPTVKNYNAQLMALDVPMNLKYEFEPQKNSNYVSVGLSSGTFISEAYNTQYNYSNASASSIATQAQQTQTTNNSFANFYFAKTLNVSFGLGYPLGKNNLVIEPFLKYPLQGLGAQQIRFGAGGINLKFDLINPKK